MDIRASLRRNDEPPVKTSAKRFRGLTSGQWMLLIALGGLLAAIGAGLVLVVRSVSQGSMNALATAIAGPTPSPTPPGLVADALPTPAGMYWPPEPQPFATPNAPSDLLWWDARFSYRRPVLFDEAASRSRAGTWARLIFDGEGVQQEGKVRADGADLRVVVWDGLRWWEIPRQMQPRPTMRGWRLMFHVQDREVARIGSYYLYYGDPFSGPAPTPEGAPDTSRLLLALGDEEAVEWGPEVTWMAGSTTTQTLVSPDGRIVIECPPGAPREDVRVRLRTVPRTERLGQGPLPDYEFHAEPAPIVDGVSNVSRWDPPLTVTINWAGLPVEIAELQSWVHFAYDTRTNRWYSVPTEFDPRRGLVRIVTDQP